MKEPKDIKTVTDSYDILQIIVQRHRRTHPTEATSLDEAIEHASYLLERYRKFQEQW